MTNLRHPLLEVSPPRSKEDLAARLPNLMGEAFTSYQALLRRVLEENPGGVRLYDTANDTYPNVDDVRPRIEAGDRFPYGLSIIISNRGISCVGNPTRGRDVNSISVGLLAERVDGEASPGEGYSPALSDYNLTNSALNTYGDIIGTTSRDSYRLQRPDAVEEFGGPVVRQLTSAEEIQLATEGVYSVVYDRVATRVVDLHIAAQSPL